MAKRHPTRRRVTSQISSEPDDAFVARVFEASTWAQKNSQLLILGGIALALILGGVLYYASYRADLNRQAVQELEVVQQVTAFGLPEEAEVRLNQYLQRFGGTRHALEAHLLLGELHLRQGRPDQAVTALQNAGAGSGPMGTQVRMLLGKAYEAAGRLPEAEREYIGVAESAGLEFQAHEALSDAARVRALSGNPAGAAELYRRILDDMEADDPQRGAYEMRLAEVEHAAK